MAQWFMLQPDAESETISLPQRDLSSFEPRFEQGIPISSQEWPNVVQGRARIPTEGLPDFFAAWSTCGIVCCSDRLRRFLLEVGEKDPDVQFLPIRAKDLRDVSRVVAPLFILHVTRVVPCLHKGKSEFLWDDPEPMSGGVYTHVKTIVLRRSAIQGLDFFRCQGIVGRLFVSRRYKDLFQAHRFTGMVFTPVCAAD